MQLQNKRDMQSRQSNNLEQVKHSDLNLYLSPRQTPTEQNQKQDTPVFFIVSVFALLCLMFGAVFSFQNIAMQTLAFIAVSVLVVVVYKLITGRGKEVGL